MGGAAVFSRRVPALLRQRAHRLKWVRAVCGILRRATLTSRARQVHQAGIVHVRMLQSEELAAQQTEKQRHPLVCTHSQTWDPPVSTIARCCSDFALRGKKSQPIKYPIHDDSRRIFGDYPHMLRLDLPRRATINESPQLTRLVGEAEREKGPVEFDCSKTEAWGPLGIALLASCLVVRAKLGRETALIEPSDPDALEGLEETGLIQVAKGQAAELDGAQVHSVALERHEPSVELAASLTSSLGASAAAAPLIVQPCLVCLLDNFFEWSESSVGGFVVVRWHKKTRHARFAMVDRGLGIPAVLRRGQVGNLIRLPDVDVIEAAFSDPSATSRRQVGQGMGLKQLREHVLGHRGKLTVISLGAKVSWAGDRVSKASSPAMHGTAVEVELSTHATSSTPPVHDEPRL